MTLLTQCSGQIIRSHGRRFIVEQLDGQLYDCTTRGKRVDFACGDYVEFTVQNQEQAVIERAKLRSSVFYRQDPSKTKVIAANISRILFVIAAVPTPNEELLGRCLVAAEASEIEPMIIVNKTDLADSQVLIDKLSLYHELQYPMVPICAIEDIAPLMPWLDQHTGVLVGQSGMGKSTLIKALLPHADVKTGTLSQALDSGRHATTHATLYHINHHSHLIDSPGLQAFGLNHLNPEKLPYYFPEMRPYIGHCRFRNCTHQIEPDCQIINAYQDNKIAQHRLILLQKITNELLASNRIYRDWGERAQPTML